MPFAASTQNDGIDIGQLKALIVYPTLTVLGLDAPAAVNLLTGTALAESRGKYLRQVTNGPGYGKAYGLWQMEEATHDDCWTNFLNFPRQSRLATLLQNMLARDTSRCDQMVSNLRYACGMARIRFYRVSAPLPSATDPVALSAYHKKWYNTSLGAADAMANVKFFQEAINA